MQPIYVTKNIIAASSTGLGTFSSANAVTLNTSSVGTARRISIWGSSGSSGVFTIVGTDATGSGISEILTGPGQGAAVSTTQDFLTLSSVSISGTITSTTGYIGTNTQASTPWQIVDTWKNPINVGFNVTPTTTGVIVSLEYTMDYPSYNPQLSVWNGNSSATGPVPTISTACSSVTVATNGSISFPFAAWRITLTSTSSGAGSGEATVYQSG